MDPWSGYKAPEDLNAVDASFLSSTWTFLKNKVKDPATYAWWGEKASATVDPQAIAKNVASASTGSFTQTMVEGVNANAAVKKIGEWASENKEVLTKAAAGLEIAASSVSSLAFVWMCHCEKISKRLIQ